MKYFLQFLLSLLFLVIVSCDGDDPVRRPSDTEYFPLQKGWYQEYSVDEIVYTLGKPETLSYALRIVVADSFANSAGGYTYVLHRSRRSSANAAWENLDTWSVKLAGNEVVMNQENIPYVVLRFPMSEGVTWNGNAYNNEINPNTNTPEDFYTMGGVGKVYAAGGKTFDDCVTVTLEDNQEYIVYYDKRQAVYGRGVGLVYTETTQLRYCTDTNQGCIGKQIVESGKIYKQTIQDYGLE